MNPMKMRINTAISKPMIFRSFFIVQFLITLHFNAAMIKHFFERAMVDLNPDAYQGDIVQLFQVAFPVFEGCEQKDFLFFRRTSADFEKFFFQLSVFVFFSIGASKLICKAVSKQIINCTGVPGKGMGIKGCRCFTLAYWLFV